MKYQGGFNLNFNNAGKGDRFRSVKKKIFDNKFDNIKFPKDLKKCYGCKKRKEWIKKIITINETYYFCKDCSKEYNKFKRQRSL